MRKQFSKVFVVVLEHAGNSRLQARGNSWSKSMRRRGLSKKMEMRENGSVPPPRFAYPRRWCIAIRKRERHDLTARLGECV